MVLSLVLTLEIREEVLICHEFDTKLISQAKKKKTAAITITL